MRIVLGKKAAEMAVTPPVLVDASRVVVDVGAGDGRWVYENARRNPASLFVALDPDAGALAQYAFRASRRPARGGVINALFVVGSVESPPSELIGRADEVKVLFPWSALLRGLLLPDDGTLRGLSALATPGASFELVLTYDASHDHVVGLDLPSLDEGTIDRLRGAYAEAGLEVDDAARLSRDAALAIPSTWGRRLLHGRERVVFRVRGRFRAALQPAAR